MLAAIAALAGLAGSSSPRLDIANNALPLLAALAGAGAIAAAGWGVTRWLCLVGLAAAIAGIAPEFVRPIPAAGAGPRDLTVLSWNVWRLNRRLGETVAAIAGSGADVVLLQESDGRIAPMLGRLARSYPYRSRCWGRCALTILSRTPFLQEKWRLRDAANRPIGPNLQWARITAPDGAPATLFDVHYSHPVTAAGIAIRRAMAATIAGRDTRDLVVAGDMNLSPWSAALRAQDRAFAPMTRATRAMFTWPAWLGGVPVPLPLLAIDQLYVGTGWRVVSVRRLPRAGSDHYGVLTRLHREPIR